MRDPDIILRRFGHVYKIYDCKLSDAASVVEKRVLSKQRLLGKKNMELLYTSINNDYVIDITKVSK